MDPEYSEGAMKDDDLSERLKKLKDDQFVESKQGPAQAAMDSEYSEEEMRVLLERLNKLRAADSAVEPEQGRAEAAVWIPVDEDELEKAANEFDANYPFRMMEMKIHRFPASLRAALGDQYVLPLVVAIGPYHHDLPRLQEMESVKRVAAYHFITDSGRSYQEVYETFLPVADKVRGLYADDAVAGINDDRFAAMMFQDACFLLQYMVAMSSVPPKSSIDDFREDQLFQRFLFSNRASINNDIMLMENQLPWQVIEALRSFHFDPENEFDPVVQFIRMLLLTFNINHGVDSKTLRTPRLRGVTAQPHLLGLFRLYKTGVSSEQVHDGQKKQGSVSVPVSATELAGIGIKLRSSKTPDLVDMWIRRGCLFDDFFLAPLYMDGLRACWLVNMAALELCTTSSFSDGTASVCSYLGLIAMLMSREEDVHRARAQGFLQGELTDKQMLSFFNTVTERISPGRGYFEILADIEACKRRRWLRIMVHKFVSDNFKTIAAVLSVIGVLVGIFKTLFSLKQHQH
ncbi:unnamed protein product [Alopecurus aequalis]